ncbi:hypothetical protein [Liberiplasma polymorphum]|jgi:hypothetical protein|uniref:hypothetical protein n=1 Tax=Liberiplasma polymorphum TaxID=3374570 RepID=UPI0037755850
MINALILIILAASIMVVLFFAYTTKNKLASYVAYTMLAAIAISMAINGLIGLIIDIDFLSFLVSLFRLLNDIILFIELGVILYLLFISKHKTKIMLLKVAIIVYVVLKLVIEFNLF